MTEKDRAAIRELLQKTRNPYEIAASVDVKVSEVREIMRSEDLEDLPGWGAVKLQTSIVSRRRSMAGGWPAPDMQLLYEMRRQHDQGRVTMCQGRDGDWIIQYAIPSRKPIRRNAYFNGG